MEPPPDSDVEMTHYFLLIVISLLFMSAVTLWDKHSMRLCLQVSARSSNNVTDVIGSRAIKSPARLFLI